MSHLCAFRKSSVCAFSTNSSSFPPLTSFTRLFQIGMNSWIIPRYSHCISSGVIGSLLRSMITNWQFPR